MVCECIVSLVNSNVFSAVAQSSFNGPATDLSLFDPRREPPNVVISGRFVAFQSLQTPKDRVGCDRSGCAATQCGQELLNEAEWFDCYSEVYKIYRRDGDGVVRVGDHVGFLQYKSYQWLQCPSDSCRLGNCPGQPNEADGFEESSKWCECDDYSFRLAAYNKTIGQPIYQNDIIMAYHPKSREFMTISGHKTSCPRTFPPSLGEYEGCIEGTYILNY